MPLNLVSGTKNRKSGVQHADISPNRAMRAREAAQMIKVTATKENVDRKISAPHAARLAKEILEFLRSKRASQPEAIGTNLTKGQAQNPYAQEAIDPSTAIIADRPKGVTYSNQIQAVPARGFTRNLIAQVGSTPTKVNESASNRASRTTRQIADLPSPRFQDLRHIAPFLSIETVQQRFSASLQETSIKSKVPFTSAYHERSALTKANSTRKEVVLSIDILSQLHRLLKRNFLHSHQWSGRLKQQGVADR